MSAPFDHAAVLELARAVYDVDEGESMWIGAGQGGPLRPPCQAWVGKGKPPATIVLAADYGDTVDAALTELRARLDRAADARLAKLTAARKGAE